MKKIFAIIMVICLLASTLCITAFAADDAPAAGTVLRVSALKKDGTTIVVIKDYDNFEDGWNYAMELAGDSKELKKNAYDRIVVDIYTDWNAVDGEFTDDWFNGDGFDNDTIYIPDGAKVTLNLGGHTINRGLKHTIADGEVMYIDDEADVIINNGTIIGGAGSLGDAGAIDIQDDARVTLNNVHVIGNTADWDGAGIFVGTGSILTVNGGSFKNNDAALGEALAYSSYGGAVHVEGTAIFDGVEFKENIASYGAAISADKGNVVVKNCIFDGNGIEIKNRSVSHTVIHSKASSITITNSTFINNAGEELFYFEDSKLLMENGSIKGNTSGEIFYFEDSDADIKNVTITDNASKTIYVDNGNKVVTMVGCTLGNNATAQNGPDVVVEEEDTLIFLDCTLGDTTVEDEDLVKVIYSGVAKEDAAISVTKLFNDGTEETTYYRFFEYGWNLAIEAAKTNTYERVIVDLYGDWNAVDGQFTDEFSNGAGFNWDAIYIPSDVKITINMNGHTINRGLTDDEDNGEVIYIGTNADVIINGGKDGDPIARGDDTNATFGTITGGNSHNGAGGIHINDGANVTLNNVRIHGNRVEDDDGAGIAVYDGATLIMNGGSFSNNKVDHSGWFYGESYGGLFVSDASAALTNVLITDNGVSGLSAGAAIFIKDGYMTIKNCYILKNGYKGGPNEYSARKIICVVGSSSVLDITDSTFENNGTEGYVGNDLIVVHDATLKINNSNFMNNYTENIIECNEVLVEITKSRFEGNAGVIFQGEGKTGSHFTECTFSENTRLKNKVTFQLYEDNKLDFNNCDLGNSTFNDRSRATFDGAVGVGSIFGEGSLTMIVAILALIASGVAIFLIVYYNKKKVVPVAANGAADTETDDEE